MVKEARFYTPFEAAASFKHSRQRPSGNVADPAQESDALDPVRSRLSGVR